MDKDFIKVSFVHCTSSAKQTYNSLRICTCQHSSASTDVSHHFEITLGSHYSNTDPISASCHFFLQAAQSVCGSDGTTVVVECQRQIARAWDHPQSEN